MSDTALRDELLDPSTRPWVVTDLDHAVAAQVKASTGISGAAVRTGYGLAQRVRPTFVTDAINHLLPEFAAALQPWWEDYPGTGGFGAFLAADGPAVAEALLQVTDRSAEASRREALRRAYHGLRGRAAKLVTNALPAVGDVIERHAS